MNKGENMLNKEQIKEIIPHRDPFLLVDEILEMKTLEYAVGKLTLTGDEYFFKGHFPDYKVMPGVLILEAMAQTGAVAALSHEDYKGKIAFFAGADNVKFKNQVKPGDTIIMKVQIEKMKFGIGFGKGEAYVNDKLCASAVIKFAVSK